MRTTLTSAAAALLVLGSGVPLAAQSTPAPAVAQQGTPAQPAATAPAAPTLPIPITFTGEVRSRTEWDAPGGAAAADLFSMLRTRFAARVDPTAGVSVVLQLQDSRVLGTETNSRVASTVDQFDLHQGYLQLSGAWRASDLALRGCAASHSITCRRQRASTSAALSPAGPPPTITTSNTRGCIAKLEPWKTLSRWTNC